MKSPCASGLLCLVSWSLALWYSSRFPATWLGLLSFMGDVMSDPIKTFYLLGYVDQKAGKKHRVCHMYKLAYVSGRYDAASGKPSRYGE